MKNLEKNFESTENLDDMLKWELAGLAGSIWLNEWAAKVASQELDKNSKHLTDTTACVMTANMDSVLDNPKKFNQLSKKDQELLKLIVNNRRGERLAEKYNKNEDNCRANIKNLFISLWEIA